ncbi:hypothetical protein [Nocardia carnea]|uniref:hypothetical protein n=1 Tax=Nocardia carnea TaxID=37328 RepID=UPI002458739F|nr:hypothetical protein [Nocardia carnea]
MFEFELSDGNAAYRWPWSSPGETIPNFGEFVAESLMAGKQLTVALWEQWYRDNYAVDGDLYMKPTAFKQGEDIGRTHGAYFRYALTGEGVNFRFTAHERKTARSGKSEWEPIAICDSVEALLEEGIARVRTQRRRVKVLRRRDGLSSDGYSVWVPSVSRMTDWLRRSEQRLERYRDWSK